MSAKTAAKPETPTRVMAVTLPVEHPVSVAWEELRPAISAGFALATDLANWAVHYLFRRDDPLSRETPDAVKPGKASEAGKAYLYGAAVRDFPAWAERCAGVASSAQCVFRAVHKKYLQDRFGIMVRRESALTTYRYPAPWPVHNANWSVSFEKGAWPGEAPVVSLPLPGVGRTGLRLARGPEFGRQLAMLRQFLDGSAKQGEAAVLRDRKGRLLVKLVGHFPLRGRGPAANVAFVHTDPAALLVVEVNGRAANVTNGDHIRRVIARHRAFRQRAGEDKKRELRMDPRQRQNLDDYIAERCGKQNDRLRTFVRQVAAQVAGMCERRGVGLVAFDDTRRDFFREGGGELPFPWEMLKTRLRQLLVDGMGCEWVDGQFTHLKDSEEKQEWLAKVRATATAGRRAVAHARREGSHPKVSTSPPPTTRPANARRSTSSPSGPSSRRSGRKTA